MFSLLIHRSKLVCLFIGASSLSEEITCGYKNWQIYTDKTCELLQEVDCKSKVVNNKADYMIPRS